MNNIIKCQDLFALDGTLFESIFSHYEYPWEILRHLGDIIESLIKAGIDEYERIDEWVLIGKGVQISGTARIDGPAIIGSGTEVRHGAFIRGSALIGERCVIGNSSEVKNSIMMDGACAPHFNYVGDSILGKRAHLGAGAICSNLRSDGKAVKIKLREQEPIDTKLRKLGAILGDGAEIGCGAILCPGTIVGKSTVVYPLTLARGAYPSDSIVKNTDTVVPKRE